MKKSIIFILLKCSHFIKTPFFILYVIFFSTLFFCSEANAISIKDSTVNGKAVYVIDWLDNDSKPRKFCLVKDSDQDYVGIAQYMQYYDGASLVNITSPLPNSGALNGGFGSTTHHVSPTPDAHRATSGHTLTLVYQGPHHVIFNWTQTIGGAIETITYTFSDGNDYFQWQNTTNAAAGTLNGDSRGPYCTMQWDGVDFSAAAGVEYAAQYYFSQPTYNGAWTFGGPAVDIPYVLEWDNNREVGYVQTQTFTQQLAGNPTWGGSLNLTASGSSIIYADIWKYDYQMNFYDQAKKITWGMPYGYMKGDAAAGTKSGWGQYSLSVVFDAMSEGGVKRVRDENRIIHNGSVTLTAIDGSIVTTGPVGTINPATQTLSPAGFDHNYRTWWTQADGTGESEFTIAVASGSLKNPTFRIKNMTALPGIVEYNSVALVANTDYYASYNSTTNEVWLTLIRNVSGSNTLRVVDSNVSGIVITSAIVTPSSVFNDIANNLTFTVVASDDASVASVNVNLSSIGGGASVAMTNSGGTTYTLNYAMSAGVSTGTKTIVVTVTDNLGNTKTQNITLTVNANTIYLDIYTDASTLVTGTWNSNGTLVEQTGGGAIEGIKDYDFGFTAVGWYAGYGLNLSNWDDAQARDFSGYENLEVSYSGPFGSGSGVIVTLIGQGNTPSTSYTLPISASYTSLSIPLSVFAPIDLSKVVEIDFSIAGTEIGTGSFRVDNIRLSRQNIVGPEINVLAAGVSKASGSTYTFSSVEEGSTGTSVTFTIENKGTSDLSLSASPKVSIAGTNASDFVIVQSSLVSPISASTSSTFTITFSPVTAGVKTATISITNSDSDEGTYTIQLSATATSTITSSLDNLYNGNLKISPNPTDKSVDISLGGIEVTKLTIRNQLGIMVGEFNANQILGKSSLTIDLAEQSSGIYYLEVETKNGKVVRRIIKQ